MPIVPPIIDDRRYQQLVDELLARVPVHTPEWTNFNHSDPGVTLVQLYAFLTENLLYRARLIPERNRAKFLQLLKIPLEPASPAKGLVTINNERGRLETQTLASGLEVKAGNISFRTNLGLDVLPVETLVCFKQELNPVPPELSEYYRLLYASYDNKKSMPVNPKLYKTVVLDGSIVKQVDLNKDTVDKSLWIAILARKNDDLTKAREVIAGRTLTLGIIPALTTQEERLLPAGQASADDLLVFELPNVGNTPITRDNDRPVAVYRKLEPITKDNLLTTPGVVQLTLPGALELNTWRDLDPLEAGVGNLPPMLESSAISERVITWLRIRTTGANTARILWTGVNAAWVEQRERMEFEQLADGDGTTDQIRQLSKPPVLKGSVEVITQTKTEQLHWTEIEDLLAAKPEVPTVNARNAPTAPTQLSNEQNAQSQRKQQERENKLVNVFRVDHEAGLLTFGDGLHGRRLPAQAKVFASYEFCQGSQGNVAPLSINNASQLPSGFTVSNPVRTWGGADAETVTDGEKQITRYLQHRDRLVSIEDFEAIAWRTPGVDIGRIDILPAFHPDFAPIEPGAIAGVVTVMAIPRFDVGQPDAPRADKLFLTSICRYLEPRRLVTTELIVCAPVYKSIWISVGIDVAANFSIAEVTEAVKQQLRKFLSPIPTDSNNIGYAAQSHLLFDIEPDIHARGWPLRMSVSSRILAAETARVVGVTAINGEVLLAEGKNAATATIGMKGLELPRILGISVVVGDPLSIADLRGDYIIPGTTDSSGSDGDVTAIILPVPIIPESC